MAQDADETQRLSDAPPPSEEPFPEIDERGAESDRDIEGAQTTRVDVRRAGGAPRAPAAELQSERSLSVSTDASAALRSTRTVELVSAAETLKLEEVRRTRAFAWIAVGLTLTVVAVLPLVHGDVSAKRVIGAIMLAVGLVALRVARLLRDEGAYTVRRALGFGFVSLLGGFAAIYYFGLFSPAPAIIPFGLYFFSVGQSYRGALAIYLTCAALELALAIAIISGVVPDGGLVRAADLGAVEKGVIVALTEATFFATFLVARASRKALIEAIVRHDEAVRALAQREALLREAREDLARALQVGGVGRFTDETLGSFKLGAVLGRGGMGEVYEAVHVRTQEPAAVKLLHGRALAEPECVRRFLREAKIVASLDVPNVVRVLEVGGFDAPVPYIAMERLHGTDLSDYLRKHRRLSLRATVMLVRQVGRGLEAAWAAGVVHRDIKPRNLFLVEGASGAGGTWKILDFGVSKLTDDQHTLTHNHVVGTPGYMAPEQIATGRVTRSADLYALGIVAYRALTGQPAFAGEAMADVLYRVVYTMPPRPSGVAKLPADLDRVFAIALAKNPEDRFGSPDELAAALAGGGRGRLSATMRERGEALIAKHPWVASA